MEKKSLQFVADMIRLLLEKEKSAPSPTTNFSASIEAFLKQKNKAESTQASSAQQGSEVQGRISALEKEVSVLKEQLEAQQDMLQMTVTHLQSAESEQGDDTSFEVLAKFLKHYFESVEKLKKISVKATLLQNSEDSGQPHRFFYVMERFGIIHFVTAQLKKEGSNNALLLALSFQIENALSARRYADASQIIENLRLQTEKSLKVFDTVHVDDIDFGLAMLDAENGEVEYASTNHAMYSVSGGVVKNYVGGSHKNSSNGEVLVGSSEFLISKMSFRKNTTLFIPFGKTDNLPESIWSTLAEYPLEEQENQFSILLKELDIDIPLQIISVKL